MGKFTEEVLFICECHSIDHQIVFSYDKEQTLEDSFVSVSIHLNKKKLWNRIVYGIKYIFGRESVYGAFDEFLFDPEDVDKLQKVVDKLKELNKKL